MMRLRICLCVLAILTMLTACGKITTVSRKDQALLLNRDSTTHSAALPTETTEATVAEETASPEETTAAPEETVASQGKQESPPKATEPNRPKDTQPTKATEPPKQTDPPTEAPTEAPTEPPTEATTEPETVPPETRDPYDLSGYAIGSLEYEIHAGINALREENSIPPLSLDSQLCAIASVRAYEASQYWSHTRPDGRDCFTVLTDYGFGIGSAAENLASASAGLTPADFVQMWYTSDGHRQNMLGEGYTRVGIGVCEYNGMTYVACLLTD